MPNAVKANQVNYKTRHWIRLVDTNLEKIYTVTGNYARWVFVDLFGESIGYSARNSSLDDAIQAWVDQWPKHRFVFLLNEDEDESDYHALESRAHHSLQEQQTITTDVDDRTWWQKIRSRLRGLYDCIFHVN